MTFFLVYVHNADWGFQLAHPQHRGKITTMYNTLWYVGSIVAAWTVFGTIGYEGDAAWRVPVALQALMPLIQFIGIWLLPESPRWLCSKDREEDALKVLIKVRLPHLHSLLMISFQCTQLTHHSQFHASGNAQDDFVRAEFAEIRQTIQLEKLAKQNGWSVFVKTPGNRKRLLLIVLTSFFSQCSGNGIASYYLHDILQSVGVTKSYDQSLVNGGLQIWSFLVAVGFSQLVDKVGRRKLFLIAAVGMLLSFSVWTGCSAVYARSGNEGAGSAVIAMVFLFYFAAGFAWPGLTVAYVAEILPFNIRAKGMAIGFACTSAASVLNQVWALTGTLRKRIHADGRASTSILSVLRSLSGASISSTLPSLLSKYCVSTSCSWRPRVLHWRRSLYYSMGQMLRWRTSGR